MRKAFYFVLALSLLFSCSDTDDSDSNPQVNHPLEGKWNMVAISAMNPGHIQPDEGDVMWKFDTENNKLYVENNTGSEDAITVFLPTGEYDISIEEEGRVLFSATIILPEYTLHLDFNFKYYFYEDRDDFNLRLNNNVIPDSPHIYFKVDN